MENFGTTIDDELLKRDSYYFRKTILTLLNYLEMSIFMYFFITFFTTNALVTWGMLVISLGLQLFIDFNKKLMKKYPWVEPVRLTLYILMPMIYVVKHILFSYSFFCSYNLSKSSTQNYTDNLILINVFMNFFFALLIPLSNFLLFKSNDIKANFVSVKFIHLVTVCFQFGFSFFVFNSGSTYFRLIQIFTVYGVTDYMVTASNALNQKKLKWNQIYFGCFRSTLIIFVIQRLFYEYVRCLLKLDNEVYADLGITQ